MRGGPEGSARFHQVSRRYLINSEIWHDVSQKNFVVDEEMTSYTASTTYERAHSHTTEAEPSQGVNSYRQTRLLRLKMAGIPNVVGSETPHQ